MEPIGTTSQMEDLYKCTTHWVLALSFVVHLEPGIATRDTLPCGVPEANPDTSDPASPQGSLSSLQAMQLGVSLHSCL